MNNLLQAKPQVPFSPWLQCTIFLLLVQGIYSFVRLNLLGLPGLPSWADWFDSQLSAVDRLLSLAATLFLLRCMSWDVPQMFTGSGLQAIGQLVTGVAGGTAIVFLSQGLTFAGHWYHNRSFNPHISWPLSIIYFFTVALEEEIIYRGYILQIFARQKGTMAALWVSAIVFGCAHLAGHYSEYSFLAALFFVVDKIIGGILFGVAYLKTRQLWLPVGLHWAYDFCLGIFYPDKFFDRATLYKSHYSLSITYWIFLGVTMLACFVIAYPLRKRMLSSK